MNDFINELGVKRVGIYITIFTTIIIPVLKGIWELIEKWSNKNDKQIKISKISKLYLGVSITLYLTTLFIPLISWGIVYNLIHLLENIELVDINLVDHIVLLYKIMVVILNILLTLILFHMMNVLAILKKYITKRKVLYYALFFNYPIFGCFIAFTYFDKSFFEKSVNLCLLIMSICMITGLLIFKKSKTYNLYSKVKIKTKNGEYLCYSYDRFIMKDNCIIIKVENKGKKIKEILFFTHEIEKIEFIVDKCLDEKYEKYLIQCFGKTIGNKSKKINKRK